MTPVGFEPTQLALVELESTPLDHSGKVSYISWGLSYDLLLHQQTSLCWLLPTGSELTMHPFSPPSNSDDCKIGDYNLADLRKNLELVEAVSLRFSFLFFISWYCPLPQGRSELTPINYFLKKVISCCLPAQKKKVCTPCPTTPNPLNCRLWIKKAGVHTFTIATRSVYMLAAYNRYFQWTVHTIAA